MAVSKLAARTGDILLMVGTVKGAFIFLSDAARGNFRMSGPHFPGQSVWSAAFIGNGAARIIVGNKSEHWGAMVSHSDDFGATWTEPTEGNIKFPAGSSVSLNSIWALETATSLGPEVVLAGVDPAALFRSDDRGETFQLNEALFNHPDRSKWNPGFGGLCLHSILVHPHDPRRMYVAISSGGIYRSDDGGGSWTTCVNGLRVHPDVPGATCARTSCVSMRKTLPVCICKIIQGYIAPAMKGAGGSRLKTACRRISVSQWSRIRGGVGRSIPSP